MIETQAALRGHVGAQHARIDVAIHNDVPSSKPLYPYLPGHWVEQIENTVFKGPVEPYYPPNVPFAARPGSRANAAPSTSAGLTPATLVAGTPPAPTLDKVQQQILDVGDVTAGVLACSYPVDTLHNPEAAVAFASAVNDWQIAEWLDKEPRLKASIVVPIQLPDLAVEEIERVADHPGFVQVIVPARTQHPLGSRVYHRVWEAIARHNLVAAVQFGGASGNPPTPVGWPSFYMEEYVDMAGVFASQVTSIVSEGVFDRFPNVKVVFLESGFTWLPPHMWRFDKEWKHLRRQVPWVKRPPSEYIRDHVRLTVLPLDAPGDPRHLLQVVDQLGSEDMLLYASHYPRVHASDPEEALLRHLPETLARKIRHENACALYGL